jgi:propionyl-CoA synthetase
LSKYTDAYNQSLANPAGFWAQHLDLVDWIKRPSRIVEAERPQFYRWFSDGTINTCFNALDRHVIAGRGDQVGLIHDSPMTDSVTEYTYAELLEQTQAFAGALTDLGVRVGDRVIIYMPMIPESVIAMLACARIGAVHSVVFGGFAAAELAVRIDDAQPTVIVSASCGLEPSRVVEYKPLLDAAIALANHQPSACVVLQRSQLEADLTPGRDINWVEAMDRGRGAPAAWVELAATDPLYILYTSGTTGRPKGIVRDNGGHALAMAWSMSNVFDIGPGQTWWAASDVGWVVGHSYIVYAPLIVGATTVLYEGKPVGTPDAGAFWRVVADHNVEGLFAAPTAMRAIKKEDPGGVLARDYDLSSLRNLFMAGERLDPDTYEWAGRVLHVPVIDNWWQTETGWPIAANLRGLEPMPTKAGSPSVSVPGFDVRILDPLGNEVGPGQEGAIVIRLPLPPGSLLTVWGDDERFVSSYLSEYDGFYLTGDGGYQDEEGYLFVMGRTDDVINVAGHRLSTGSMEAVISGHPAVAECAVIGVADELKGQVPRGFIVLKSGLSDDPEQVKADLVAMVRDSIGPVAAFRTVSVVNALPKTRSGKILRRTMRQIADGATPEVPSTIEDPKVLESLVDVLRE